MNRLREATTVANNACKQMNHAAAALTVRSNFCNLFLLLLNFN